MMYDFECQKCGAQKIDVWQAMNDPHVATCDDCGAEMGQIYHSPSIQCDGEWAHSNARMGLEIRGKQHWEQELKKRGEVPYQETPEMKQARKDAKPAAAHARRGDPEARKEVRGVMMGAEKTARRRRIKNALND